MNVNTFSFWLMVFAVVVFLIPNLITKETKETIKIRGEWCYLKTIQAGEPITENNAGVYEYQIYATQEGIEVWTPCE
jgi:hypothetical protein